jgi:hypothetical protein
MTAPQKITWTRELLASIPDDVFMSEVQRRRARKRQTYTGGLLWKKHNPNVQNCRCVKCTAKREQKDS